MKNISCIFIFLVGLSACQTSSQIVATPAATVILPSTTATPTVFAHPTGTGAPTATPTVTPLAYSTPIRYPSTLISPENIQDLQELAVLGKGKVNSFRYSSDGKLLAVATMKGIYIYDAQTFIEKKYIRTDDAVNSVAFSPDGKTIASTFQKGAVRLWQLSTGELLDTLENSTGYTSGSLIFSPDGSLLLSAAADNVIRAWQIPGGKLVHTFRGDDGYSLNGMVDSMSISPDGSLLATTDGYETVWIWRIATGELLHKLDGNHVAFSPDGNTLAVGKDSYTEDPLVMLWQVSDWTLINTISSSKGMIVNMVFSPDGKTLLINDDWGEAKLLNISNQSILMCLQCEKKSFAVISFSPGGANITTVDKDGILQAWKLPDGTLLHTFEEHLGSVTSLAFSPDKRFLAASNASSLSLWRLSDSALLDLSLYKSYNYPQFDQSMAFSPDSRLLAFAPYNAGLRLREVNNSDPVLTLNDDRTANHLAFSSKGTTLAVDFGIEHTIELRQVADGTLLDTLVLSGLGGIDALAYSPDDNFLAVGRYGRVEIWRLSDKTLFRTLTGVTYSVGQIVFSPNGNIFATGSNTIQWSGTDGTLLQSLSIRGHTFSPDISLVLQIQGQKVHIYRMSDGKLIRTLRFNTYPIDAGFSVDGNLLAIAGNDGTISILGIP